MVHLFAALPAVDGERVEVKRIHNCRRYVLFEIATFSQPTCYCLCALGDHALIFPIYVSCMDFCPTEIEGCIKKYALQLTSEDIKIYIFL